MDRMACVDLPAFPLQFLLRQRKEWTDLPVAVVDSDKPQGIVLWVNERARSFRILPGMRYAAGLSLAGGLRAAEVSPEKIGRAVASLSRRLGHFTPSVEAAEAEPGTFWLDASGLERLYGSLKEWGRLVRSDLERQGLQSTLVVGFTRFGAYALSRAKRGTLVLDSRRDEYRAVRRVPLDRLAMKPAARDTLGRLGIRRVGEFIDLPPEGIEKRFGVETARLYRFASGVTELPLQPQRPDPPVWQRRILEHPETNVARLMCVVEEQIRPLFEVLADRGQALSRIRFGFRFERMGDHIESIRPAAPTLDVKQVLDLIRLRLEAVRRLPDPVNEVVLLGEGTPATQNQLQLFAGRPRRDLDAANRALARVRAEFGESAVVRATLHDGHLPEGRFTWDRFDAMPTSEPRDVRTSRLIRRIYSRPIPLPSRPRHEPDGWMLRGLEQGPVVRVQGPYVVSGGWWHRTVHREYHFAETRKGELLWVYYDRPRRRWFLHGRVE